MVVDNSQRLIDNQIRLLLVEDEKIFYLVVQKLLEEDTTHQYQLDWAQNLAEAINKFQNNTYNIALFDFHIHEHTGLELLHICKQHKIKTPIIMLTSNQNSKIIIESMKAGAVDYLLKDTLDRSILIRALNYALDRKLAEETIEKTYADIEKYTKQKTYELLTTNAALQAEIKARIAAEKKLREAKERAEVANQAKSTFLANISHEIRTPLNGVISMTELLFETELSAKQKRYIQTAQNCAEALLNIIEDILDLAKMEAGKLTVQIQSFDLFVLAENVVDRFLYQAGKKGIDLELRLPADCPRIVLGDAIRLGQVFTNLINNAIKFTHKGKINFSIIPKQISEKKATIEFRVMDTGIGIAKEALPIIFNTFSQEDPTTTRRYGGAGLGLSISNNLVKLMGGSLHVESEKNLGSTFYFSLNFPLNKETPITLKKHNLQEQRILVVDDEPITISFLQEKLIAWGARPTFVKNFQEADLILKNQGTNEFQLVLISDSVANSSATTIPDRLKKMSPTKSAFFVLLMQAGSTDISVATLQESGYVASIAKPILISTLMDTLFALGEAKNLSIAQPLVAQKFFANQLQNPRFTTRKSSEPPLRVLLVEDNSVNQDAVTERLEILNCHVEIAENGQQALEKINRSLFDIIFMDCQMPLMDGYEATRQIRKEFGHLQTPIIAMTAHAMSGDRELCLAAGMDDYMVKPTRLKDIQAMIEKWAPSDRKNLYDKIAENLSDLPKERRHIVLHKIIDHFIKDTPAELQTMEAACETKDWKKVAEIAHKLKGGCKNLGIPGLPDICQQLEEFALRQCESEIKQALKQLVDEYTHIFPELENILENPEAFIHAAEK